MLTELDISYNGIGPEGAFTVEASKKTKNDSHAAWEQEHFLILMQRES